MPREFSSGPTMLSKIKDLLEMIRFSHTIFALPFALLAATMAWVTPAEHQVVAFNGLQLVGILVAMVGARSAAMAFNRLVDARIDADNPRTKDRHIPAGKVSVSAVIVFVLVSVLVFLAGTLCFLPNYLPLVFAAPVLMVLLGYSYAKRFTILSHFWLGAALMLAPICVWIAIRGIEVTFAPSDIAPAVVLGLVVLFWVAGFDMIYACQDFEFDRQSKLNSIPVRFGIAGALRLAAASHAVMIVLLTLLPFLHIWVGPRLGLGWLYGLAVVGIAGLLTYEHWIVRPDDLTRVNMAFFNVNAVVSMGLFVLAAIDLLFL